MNEKKELLNRKSRLPEGGKNKFQEIKKKEDQAIASGKKIYKLSIGQPVGSAFLTARAFTAMAAMMDTEDIHGYQDNATPGVTSFYQAMYDSKIAVSAVQEIKEVAKLPSSHKNFIYKVIEQHQFILDSLANHKANSPNLRIQPCPDFAKEFCQFHNKTDLSEIEGLEFLPVPGLKPSLKLIPLACHSFKKDLTLKVATMTNPGYPVPETWADYLSYDFYQLPLNPENNFRFSVTDITPDTDLIMLNYPHNPSGQTATEAMYHELCAFCQEHNIRVFVDAAYAKLAFGENTTFADIAVLYPMLSWAEGYSSSKLGCNFTGSRVGAIVGTEDFIKDITTIKGNDDSGLVASAAVGVLAAIRYEKEAIKEYCLTFQDRQDWLSHTLTKHGMRSAIEPQATFFNIWQLPIKAFGQTIVSAEHFNYLMIEETGVVGVHFDPYIRYAVVADILQPDFQKAIEAAFEKAQVEY